jgi:uncharacterized protein (TIGR03435 family)
MFSMLGVFAAIGAVALGGLSATPTWAQSSQIAAPTPYKFEVASIRPSSSDASGGNMTVLGRNSDRFSASNIELLKLIRAAYGIPIGAEDSRITGGPGWLKTEKYDVDAKIDGSAVDGLKTLSQDQRTLAQQQMLQELLADRCKLAIHREIRNLATYTLVVAKNGPKVESAKPEETAAMNFGGHGEARSITGQARSMADLVRALSVALGCPVFDKTGLAGKYDFKLEWAAQDGRSQLPSDGSNTEPSAPSVNSEAPSIFEGLQGQLGLKLVSGKGPVEVLVIDHVERPSAN